MKPPMTVSFGSQFIKIKNQKKKKKKKEKNRDKNESMLLSSHLKRFSISDFCRLQEQSDSHFLFHEFISIQIVSISLILGAFTILDRSSKLSEKELLSLVLLIYKLSKFFSQCCRSTSDLFLIEFILTQPNMVYEDF